MSKHYTERETLNEIYLYVVKEWAVYAGEIADALDRSVTAVNTSLRKLERAGLLVGDHVNGERKLMWQSYYNTQDYDEAEELLKAQADFDDAFPNDPKTKADGERAGGGGPRYTPEQIKKGIEMTVAGKTAKEVAEAVGVKSPNYFRKVCREGIERAAAAVKADAKKRGGGSGRKSARVANRVVKRSRKEAAGDGPDDGPEALKKLMRLR